MARFIDRGFRRLSEVLDNMRLDVAVVAVPNDNTRFRAAKVDAEGPGLTCQRWWKSGCCLRAYDRGSRSPRGAIAGSRVAVLVDSN